MTQCHNRQRHEKRARLLAALIGGPLVIASLGLCVMETWRWMRPGAPLFAAPVAASLTDAISNDDVAAAYGFIRAGQDPNAVIPIRHPVFTGGRRVEVRPLLWAVATQSKGAVGMLLGFGAHLDAATRRQATCLAEELGRADIVRLLQFSDAPSDAEPCPVSTGGTGAPSFTNP